MEFKNQEFNSSKLMSYLNGLSSANRDAGVRELALVSDLKRADLLNIYKYVSIFGMSELFFDVFATHPLLVETKSYIKLSYADNTLYKWISTDQNSKIKVVIFERVKQGH